MARRKSKGGRTASATKGKDGNAGTGSVKKAALAVGGFGLLVLAGSMGLFTFRHITGEYSYAGYYTKTVNTIRRGSYTATNSRATINEQSTTELEVDTEKTPQKQHQQPEIDEVVDEHALQLYMYNQRMELLNESTIVSFLTSDESTPFFQAIGPALEIISNDSMREDFFSSDDPVRDLVLDRVCDAIQACLAANQTKPHVLVSHLNANWGAFSEWIPNRTINWLEAFVDKETGNIAGSTCSEGQLWAYVNHPNVTAIFTPTHQAVHHPKILPLPLGVENAQEAATNLQKTLVMKNRTQLLMINYNEDNTKTHRNEIRKRIVANFRQHHESLHIGNTENTYNYSNLHNTFASAYDNGGKATAYFDELTISKFIICPSGMGYDTYRTWEALAMGAVPVLETLGRDDGFFQAFEDLPVLWVDHYYNVTPPFLEDAYPRILERAHQYKLEKLTKQWWIDLIQSYRPSKKQAL